MLLTSELVTSPPSLGAWSQCLLPSLRITQQVILKTRNSNQLLEYLFQNHTKCDQNNLYRNSYISMTEVVIAILFFQWYKIMIPIAIRYFSFQRLTPSDDRVIQSKVKLNTILVHGFCLDLTSWRATHLLPYSGIRFSFQWLTYPYSDGYI
jgi:hypothetical protein